MLGSYRGETERLPAEEVQPREGSKKGKNCGKRAGGDRSRQEEGLT